jgi:FHS family glucose/mannose:H+ symporter-like MFS transporter
VFNRNLVFIAACLGMLLFGIVFLSLGAVVNLLQAKFNLDNNALGTLATLPPLGMLFGSLIFGPVVDRYGYKALLIICALLVMLGLEGLAFARSMAAVYAGFLLIGFGGGVLNGGTNALVADISEGARSARLSLLGVFFGIGALGMPGILAALSKHFRAEAIVAGVGFFVLLPVAYFVAIRFPAPKQAQGSSWLAIVSMLHHPLLWLFGLVLFFQSGLEGTTNDWSPRYMKDLGVANQAALLALTVHVAALTATRLALGAILKRISSEIVLAFSIACALVGAATLSFAASYPAALCGVVLLGIGYAACFPIVLSYIGDRFASASGTAFSIAFIFALIGNMSVNKSMGRIAQHFGIGQFSTVLLATITAIAIFLWIALRYMKKSDTPTTPV